MTNELSNLKNDIDRLTKQKLEIEGNIAQMVKQTEDYYLKRRKAAQELDAIKLENEAFLKNLQKDKNDLQAAKSDLEAKQKDFQVVLSRLGESKDTFAKERAIYKDKEVHLAIREHEYDERMKALLENEKRIDVEGDELAILIAKEKQKVKELKDSQDKLDELINSYKTKEVELNKRLADIESERKTMLDEVALKENTLKVKEEDFNKESGAKRTELDLLAASLIKRELEIARKEKDIQKLTQDVKARKEQIEIEEGRNKKDE